MKKLRPGIFLPAAIAALLVPVVASLFAAGGRSDNVALAYGRPEARMSALTAQADHDDRYFQETGFRIDDDAIWSYFNLRGGEATFGLPISRTFRFLGFETQLFQRKLVHVGPAGNAQLMNLLDPELMGFDRINFSTFPPFDPALAAAAPVPNSPGYEMAIVEFVRQLAPNTWQDQPVNFFATFEDSVTCAVAFPDQACHQELLPLMNLEIWGSVTSRPMADPNNDDFVYLRLQRGIMHFDATHNVTLGILLGDWFKSLMTGENLPLDLEQQAREANSPYLRQYCPGEPNWLCNPTPELAGTDLTLAFEPQ